MAARPEPVPVRPGQESVWDYPCPPRLEAVRAQVEVIFGGETMAVTLAPLRVLETGHPPVWYLPPDSVVPGCFTLNGRTTVCGYKGVASYFTAAWKKARAVDAAWTYLDPAPGYEAMAGYMAFYAGRMEVCLVDGEMVSPQPGGFYGGWVTSRVAGPFRGVRGSEDW